MPAIQEELQDGGARRQMQIEGPVHELELRGSAVEQALHRRQKGIERKCAHGQVERRQTKLAGEGTAARGFDVNHALGEILIRVKLVGRGELRERRKLGGDDVRQTLLSAL